MGEEEKRVAKEHKPPSPLPHYLEGKSTQAFPDKARKGSTLDARDERDASRVDELLRQADSILDGDQARVREKNVLRSVEIHRRRMNDIREYQRSKETPQRTAAHQQKGPAPLKSLDDWLRQTGTKIRSRNARELEKHPTPESYYARQVESASQYDSEMRANQMVKNNKKLREVEGELKAIYNKSKAAGQTDAFRPITSFPVDEVMSKLTADGLQQVHAKFKALGGEMNLVEFIEVVSSYMPANDWQDHSSMVNNLCEVYERLDIDGDGIVTWDEVFEFTIEMGRSTNKGTEKVDDVILDYKPSKVQDQRGELPQHRTGGVKDGDIERMESLALMDRIAVLEKDSAVIKLYDAVTLEISDCLIGHKGPVMRCLHLEGTDYIVSSGTDACLIFWGAYTNTLRQVLPCREVFMALVWDAAHHTLYAGTTSGYIHCFRVPDEGSATTGNQIEEIDRFSGHKDVMTDMLAIRDLGVLITASMDDYERDPVRDEIISSNLRVWDLAGHELKRDMHGHANGIFTLGYVNSQRYLISAGFDHDCKIWNPMITEALFTLKGHNSTIAGVKVILGSNRVVTADYDGVVKVWDIRNFMCTQTIEIEKAEPGSVTCITYVSRLDRIVVACVGLSARRVHKMFCLDYEHPSAPDVADDGPLVTALVSMKMNTITTAAMRTVRFWDARTGLLKKTFLDIASSNITAICYDNREQRLFVGEENGNVGVYNCLTGALLKKLDPHEADVCALSYCPFSKCIVSASWGGRVRIHHDIVPDATQILRQIDGHASAVTCMAYSVKLSTIATACSAGNVRLWDFNDMKLAATLHAHTTEVTLVYWIEEYRVLLTGDFLGNLIMWTVSPWKEKYKPVVRWEYIVKINEGKPRALSAAPSVGSHHSRRGKAAPSPLSVAPQDFSPEAKRDTPTCCAFHPETHTIFIGGTVGEIVAYDLKAVKGALIEWMGVDATGKKQGTKVPPLAPRMFVRNPRRGRTQHPEPKGSDDARMIDSMIKSSGDINFDIGQSLEWSKDLSTDTLLTPRLDSVPDAVRRLFAWTAHQDSIKSIQLVEVMPNSYPRAHYMFVGQTRLTCLGLCECVQKPNTANDAADDGASETSTFMTEAPERRTSSAYVVNGVLLSASVDQRVCLWSLQGRALGQLRQGDRETAQSWEFPWKAEVVEAFRKESLSTYTRQLDLLSN